MPRSAARGHGRALLLAALVLVGQPSRGGDQPGLSQQAFAQIERGRYLTVLADCTACHTDPREGKSFAGGRPIQTPFGTLLSPNITPDPQTGIGRWTAAQFDAAVRYGKMPDGRLIYPAMPYVYYNRMPPEDVQAIWAYLKTVEPVNHPVVSNQLPFPFRIRGLLWFWNLLYFKPRPFRPDPARSEAWNRGAYLTQGPEHCPACHTPKSFLGGDKSGRTLQGYALGGWFAPDITNDNIRGLGGWSAQDIVEYLKKGHNRFAAASGPMGDEVGDSSSKVTDSDLQAIATYLKEQPGDSTAARPVRADDPVMQAGAAIYEDLCSACHKGDGTGVPYLIPNLVASPTVAARDPTTMLQVILRGAQSVSTRYEPTAPEMPTYGWQLTDAQIAAVTTYVRNSWNHAAGEVTEGQVRKARRQLNSTSGAD
jgi:mono/diheme cytochrome c family protein